MLTQQLNSSSSSIIDVLTLPTINQNSKVIYRLPDGSTFAWNGTEYVWQGTPLAQLVTGYEYFNHFELGHQGLSQFISNGGSVSFTNNVSLNFNHYVNFRVSTNGGVCTLSANNVGMANTKFTMQSRVRIVNLSNDTDNAIAYFGKYTFQDRAVNQTNLQAFVYDRFGESAIANASPNWQLATKQGANITIIDSGIPVITTDYVVLKMIYTPTKIEFFINNMELPPIETNIFTGFLPPRFSFIKTKGSGIMDFENDYLYYKGQQL